MYGRTAAKSVGISSISIGEVELGALAKADCVLPGSSFRTLIDFKESDDSNRPRGSDVRLVERERFLVPPSRWRGTVVTNWRYAPGARIGAGSPLIQLGDTWLRSPLNGTLSSHHVAVGDICSAGPLATMSAAHVDGHHFVIALQYEGGMGLTLWGKNRDAWEQFDSYIPPEDLPISDGLRSDLTRVTYLTWVGWERELSSQEPRKENRQDDKWRHLTLGEAEELNRLRPGLMKRLVEELGPEFSVYEGTDTLDVI